MKHEIHLTQEQLRKFHSREMTPDELLAFMEVMKDCPFCNGLLADSFDVASTVPAPKNFKSSVLERSRRADIQFSNTVSHVTDRTRLFLYSLKVITAVTAALILLFSLPTGLKPEPPQKPHTTEAEKYQSNSFKGNLKKEGYA